MSLSVFVIGSLILFCVVTLIFFGRVLFRRSMTVTRDGRTIQLVRCHLCSKEVEIDRTIERERQAGVVHYYCGSCIELLYAEHIARMRKQGNTDDSGTK